MSTFSLHVPTISPQHSATWHDASLKSELVRTTIENRIILEEELSKLSIDEALKGNVRVYLDNLTEILLTENMKEGRRAT